MIQPIELIGLSGKAGSGKDWIFEHYLKPLGYHRFALADHFKIAAVGRKLATYTEVFYSKPPHVRKALQLTGTEEGRMKYHENVWCDTALAWMQHYALHWGVTKYCITDIRFPNEVQFVQQHDGFVLRLQAEQRVALNGMSPEGRQHPSETALDDYLDFDFFIPNDIGEEHKVQAHVQSALDYSDLLRSAA